jgi:RNA polymerase sigma factor (sigma-70 family)
MDDAALARRLQGGDAGAWADVYDRYADRLHDYCASILHDRHEAEDALHDAFVTASQRIDQLRDPDRLRPWLYAICRTSALARARRRTRAVPTEDTGAMTVAPELPDPVEAADLQRLVWDAAEGLAPQDKAVLYLHLRHGLTGEALGEALEVPAHHANVRLSRVRGLVERSLTVLLVGRLGRRDCPELDALLAGWDGRLDPRLRKRVARHIDGCEVCEERRRTVVSPLGLLAAMPIVPAPPDLRDRVLTSVGTRPDGAGGSGGSGGGAASAWGRRLLVVGAIAAVIAGAVVALALRPGGLEPEEVAVTAFTTTTTEAPTSTTTLAPTSTTAPPTSTTVAPTVTAARLVVRTGAQDLGASTTEAIVTFANEGGAPLAWTAGVELPGALAVPAAGTLAPGATTQVSVRVDRPALPEGSFGGTLVLEGWAADGSDAGTARVGITGQVRRAPAIGDTAADRDFIGTLGPALCRQSEVRADVTDESPLTVVLRWSGGGASGTSSLPMARRGGEWVATLGPPTEAVDITWWIVATDALGTTSRGPDRVLDVQQVC